MLCPSHSASSSCPHEPRGNCLRRGLCRGSTPETRQCRVSLEQRLGKTAALSELPSPRESVLQARTSELTPGCLSSAGITALALSMHFVAIGAHACDSCRLLKSVDLCNTNVEEIPEFAFVHCTGLREVLLPTTLHTIQVKAFMNCAALVELAIPPSLRYIGSRAFFDCTVFSRLAKMPGRHKWRGVYAEENAFASCPAVRWPPWLHMIPDMGTPLVLYENKPFWPQQALSRSYSLSLGTRLSVSPRQAKNHTRTNSIGELRNIAIVPLYRRFHS